MKLFDSFKVCLLGLAASAALVACDKDDDDKTVAAYAGSFNGDMVVSGEWNGKTMFSGTVNGDLIVTSVTDTTVNITVPEIVNLDAGRSVYNVDPFTIPNVKVVKTADGYSFSVEDYSVEDVMCDQGSGAAAYLTTGSLNGTYQSGVMKVTYLFTLGKMPFPLKGEFEGIKK